MHLQSTQALMREAERLLEARSAPRKLTPQQTMARQMSLAQFVREAWHVVEPGTPLLWGWHLQAVCDHVEAVLTGRLGRRNLNINVPPGMSKSTIVSVMAPAWMWINRPSWRVICASGAPAVAIRDSLRCRAIVESPWYRNRFGISWKFSADQNQKTVFQNTASGFRATVTSGSRITGSRADGLIVDDALDAADAYSDAARAAISVWWREAFANRLADPRSGARIVIQQRLHVEDLSGLVLATEPALWESLVIAQEWEEASRYTTSLGWTDPRTADGELMFPERFPADIIAAEKSRLGSSAYAGQHQQRPFAAQGEVFRRGCLQFWPRGAELPQFTTLVISLDTAFKQKESSDYSVGFAIAQFEKGYFVLDRLRGRYSYPQLKAVVMEWAAKWRPSAVLIEDAASGQSLIQELRTSTALPITPVRPDGDKLARAHTVVPSWEAGRIYVQEGTQWLPEFLEELHAFPKAPHDDQVDAFVQGIRNFTQWTKGRGFFEFMRQEAERVKQEQGATVSTAESGATASPDADEIRRIRSRYGL